MSLEYAKPASQLLYLEAVRKIGIRRVPIL